MKGKLNSFVIVLLVCALITSCTSKKTSVPEATKAPGTVAPTAIAKPAAPEYIEIGASIPLTGKFGSLGSQVKVGYDYAIADINAAGGVYVDEYGVKVPLRLTAYDDESDPTKAVNNLEKVFSDQKVVAYLGGAASGMHAATTAIAEKNKVPYLGISFAWWNIHQRGYKYLFSPFPKSPDQARDVFKALNEMIPADQRPTKVAIFQEKTDWGNELGGLFKADAKPAGYDVVYYGEYAPGTTDFSTLILDAQTAGADMLLGMPSTPDGMAIVKQMSELGWSPKFTMLVRAPDAATWGKNLGTAGDYVTMFAGWHSGENFPGVAEINAKHEKEFGRPADILVGPAYACVQILADAITRAGKLDRDAIRDAIADTDMMTVIGSVTFNGDGTGNVLNPLVQWLNGKMELVWPLDQKTADFVYPAPAFGERSTTAPVAEPTKAPAAGADIKGMKVCYLIPALSNTFLNNLANSVKAKAAADGVEVFVYGADEGGATQQYSQIENCISMGVKAMIVMAPGSIESVLPAVEEAKKKGIKVIGVPPGDLEPFDAIMHTDQLEDGTKMAEMACNFINATYPDAADKSVEVAIIGNETGDLQMKLRAQGMRTIGDNCKKANVVQFLDLADESISATASAAENILTAHPNVKVFLVQASAGAQGVSQTIKALPNVDVSKYGVFAGDMDPTMIETVKSCQDPYKGLVAIGGTNLDQATYDLLKKLLQGVEYPKITNDVLEPIFCEVK
jgi:ABC-type branched-subunit amino acid transport system substrate-binding protein